MILLPVIALLLLLESLLLVALGASAAATRLGGDRRLAVEAAATLETALAMSRVDHAGSIAGLAAGDSVSLPVSPGGGWVARSVAHREPGSRMIRLVVQVALPDAQGRPMASARATLLLQSVAADTAIVTAERPRF